MRKAKQSRWIGIVTFIPIVWNACSPVDFSTNSDTAKISCAESGANPSTCVNPRSEFKQMSQSIDVKANSDVDILFVVDNSGSMAAEQSGIGNRINGFIDKIKDLNWQIALTTTDGREKTLGPDKVQRAWGDGQFRPFDSDTGNQYILRSIDVTPASAQSMLANAIYVGANGDGFERGINATYRSIARASSPSANKDFFRLNAKLAVVLVSDEDECSTGLDECVAKGSPLSQSDPKAVLSYIKSQFGQDKLVSFNSIVFMPNDSSCSTGKNEGDVYKEMTQLTNGVMGSICSNDFTTPLSEIGKKVVELVNSISLSCAPVDINSDGKLDLAIVLADGSTMTSGFQISGSTVSFSSALPEGKHSFYYFCK